MSLNARELANVMADELDEAWQEVKGVAFPGGNREDARVMFLAVARGLLLYLEQHKGDMVANVTIDRGGGATEALTVRRVDLDTEFNILFP